MDSPSSEQWYLIGFVTVEIVALSWYSGKSYLSEGSSVRLSRETDNKYDSNAIAVHTKHQNTEHKAGYICRICASIISFFLDSSLIRTRPFVLSLANDPCPFFPCQLLLFSRSEDSAFVESMFATLLLPLLKPSDPCFAFSGTVISDKGTSCTERDFDEFLRENNGKHSFMGMNNTSRLTDQQREHLNSFPYSYNEKNNSESFHPPPIQVWPEGSRDNQSSNLTNAVDLLSQSQPVDAGLGETDKSDIVKLAASKGVRFPRPYWWPHDFTPEP